MTVSVDVTVSLGDTIRQRRHQLGLTLVEVAARAGLSHPFLSQLERGLARPSMGSLTAIALALGTTAQALMATAESSAHPGTDPISVIRRSLSPDVVESPGGSVRSLVRGERAMLPVEFRGAPVNFEDYYCHAGEEFVYVTAGVVEIDIDGTVVGLGVGETAYYAGGLRHRWRGLGDCEAVRLVVVQHNVSLLDSGRRGT